MAKPTYKRATRVADQIRMEIADILMRKTKDPRIGVVTVTDVEVTDDLRLARVYVTVRGDEGTQKGAFIGLEKAAGFIRSELGRRVQLRYTPELAFHRDEAGERGDRVLSLLEQARAQERDTGEPANNMGPKGDAES